MSQVHSLLDAEVRHGRAQEHLDHVELCLDRIETQRKFVVSDSEAASGERSLQLPQGASPADNLRVRLGEQVFNLRSTLDYIVYVLSGGKSTAQFPLEDSPKRFASRKTSKGRFLIGVAPEHCDLIERFQPYPPNGPSWAGLLQRLSNQDKHRELVPIQASTRNVLTETNFPGLFPGSNLYPGPNVYPSSGYREVQIEFSIDVTLPDGTPVRQGAQELQTQVGNVLALFKREIS